MAPILALVGLRWTTVAAALATVAAWAGAAWAPVVPWWWLVLGWLLLFSPAGRIGVGSFDDTGDFAEITVWGKVVEKPAKE